jgi:hypothetical protein
MTPLVVTAAAVLALLVVCAVLQLIGCGGPKAPPSTDLKQQSDGVKAEPVKDQAPDEDTAMSHRSRLARLGQLAAPDDPGPHPLACWLTSRELLELCEGSLTMGEGKRRCAERRDAGEIPGAREPDLPGARRDCTRDDHELCAAIFGY